MAFYQRRLLLLPRISQVMRDESCSSYDCNSTRTTSNPPSPPPPPPAFNQNNHLTSIFVLMFCVLGSASLLICYLTIVTRYRSNLNNPRRRNPPNLNHIDEDFIDEDQDSVVHHPIWFINTVGLQQSVIDSIAVFKYKRDEGLIEGTDCSVCLNEFQEDESLRLLPKCGHAFHIPCIDTWLRSHTNCPVCRAPVASDTNNTIVNTVELNLNELNSREETQAENLDSARGVLGSHQVGEDETGEILRVGAEILDALPTEEGKIAEILEKKSRYLNARSCEARVLSDLANHRAKVEEEVPPVRRSISMDSASASMIYLAVANIRPMEHEGCSDTQLVQAKKPNSQKVGKRGNRSSSSIYKVMKSSSFGRSSQKGPTSMKRSFSSGGKRSQSRYSKSQDSIPPF